MTKTAVFICPGRGTYNKPEHGYLKRHHADQQTMFAEFDALRVAEGQTPVTELDGTGRFSAKLHTRGDTASPLIYAASIADFKSLHPDIEIVAITGNSMGWYIALAAAGALSLNDGFRVVNTMGRLMQDNLIGGQLIYLFVDENWQDNPIHKADILEAVQEINAEEKTVLTLSINLGGLLVLAGNEDGLSQFEARFPPVQGRYPMRLPNHAAFHSNLQRPVAEMGRAALPAQMFGMPDIPLIDGRGEIWWPHSTDTEALWDYTLRHQVVETYDFTKAISIASREFAPDYFIVSGPGNTLGGAVAQSLILTQWQGLRSKTDFQTRQSGSDTPLLVSMGLEAQRPLVTT